MPEDNRKQDPIEAPTKTIKEPTAPSNPLYGCVIFLIVVTTFSSIITWTIYSGLKQSKELGEFTIQGAPPMEAIPVNDAQKEAIKTKLSAFAAMANGGKPVELTLTTEELNTMIVVAADAQVADYRDQVRFTGYDAAAKLIKADIRWKINNFPGVSAPDRFLVGHVTFKPVIENSSIDLHMESIDVPGKTVSKGFLMQIRNMPWLNLAKLKDDVKNPLSKVTSFEFSPEGSIFALHAGEAAK